LTFDQIFDWSNEIFYKINDSLNNYSSFHRMKLFIEITTHRITKIYYHDSLNENQKVLGKAQMVRLGKQWYFNAELTLSNKTYTLGPIFLSKLALVKNFLGKNVI